MRQVIFSRHAPVHVAAVPIPALKPGMILVRTHFSAISVGTERAAAVMASSTLIEKALARREQVVQVLGSAVKDGIAATARRVRLALEKWIPGGYSNAGVVVAVADDVSDFHVGDRVACGGGGYAVHADYCAVPKRLAVRVPDGVQLEDAAFATIGAVALHGFRIGDVTLGERVAVIGLGIVGQLLCQIAAAGGAHVIPIDLNADRVRLAEQLVGSRGLVAGKDSDVQEVRALTAQRGVDVAFICAATASSQPAELATSIVRDRGRIVVVGDVGLALNRQVMYDKELELRVSRSYGPGRYDRSYEEKGQDYPFSYVRWTEQRNIEAFLELAARGSLKIGPLVSQRFEIAEADEAFKTLTEGEPPIGALISYESELSDESSPPSRTLALPQRSGAAPATPRVALIGPGAFASSVLMPALERSGIAPQAIVGAGGVAATDMGRQVGATRVTTDVEQLWSDSSIDTVFIASRHDSHAPLAMRALRAGKHVFVEKPLATSNEQLTEICDAYAASAGSLMVGFNRRFAPLVREALAFLPRSVPPMMLYRVNAGALASGHWTTSADEGGGRIVGEACHFVDLMHHIAGAPIASVYAQAQRAGDALEEDVSATLTFTNGAVGTLIYTSQGSARVAKEYLEVFAGGRVAIIDDFASLTLADGRARKTRRARQDKGFDAEVQAFIASLRAGGPSPIPFAEAVISSLATLAILESCRTGEPVAIPAITT